MTDDTIWDEIACEGKLNIQMNLNLIFKWNFWNPSGDKNYYA